MMRSDCENTTARFVVPQTAETLLFCSLRCMCEYAGVDKAAAEGLRISAWELLEHGQKIWCANNIDFHRPVVSQGTSAS